MSRRFRPPSSSTAETAKGFLAFSEIHPDYYQIPVADRMALLAAQAERAMADEEDGFDSLDLETVPAQKSVLADDNSSAEQSEDG